MNNFIRYFILFFYIFTFVTCYRRGLRRSGNVENAEPDFLTSLLSVGKNILQSISLPNESENTLNPTSKAEPDLLTNLVSLGSNILLSMSRPNEPENTRTDVIMAEQPGQCRGAGTLYNFLASSFDMTPDTIEDIGIEYSLFMRNIRNPTTISMSSEIVHPEFDPEKLTIFIVHGFMSYGNASWVNDMAEAFLKWGDVNVIVVDWSKGSSSWKYWKAAANTKIVGHNLHKFIKFMMTSAGLRPEKLHLIGHSLGAHVCSYASKGIKGIKRITGLDPSHMCFGTKNIGPKLDKSNADFVDVIHTHAGFQDRLYLGIPEPMGHADFYPNGGSSQPGCNQIKAGHTTNVLEKAICNHGRAHTYFTETLRHPDCVFLAQPWDTGNKTKEPRECSSIKPSKRTYAVSKPCALMGMPADGKKGSSFVGVRASGTYYVNTNKHAPWCQFANEKVIKKTAGIIKLLWTLYPRLRSEPVISLDDNVSRIRDFLKSLPSSSKKC